VIPRPEETVVSQLARQIFGGGILYYEIQIITMLILVLAANTSFADFPRWWQHLLHNQTALLIKGALLFHKRVVVVDVPFHLDV
jgi:hypothetical protein